jgi:DNA-binding response OmpR family regulator
MIVEDDRFTASYAANILSKEYELSVCRTGEEGIIAYIEHAPDIVFLDIHLPGLNGHDTLRAIKAADPKAFVVMLSVDTAKTSIVESTQSGAHSFLKKPFSKERLLNTVKASPYVRGIHDDSR